MHITEKPLVHFSIRVHVSPPSCTMDLRLLHVSVFFLNSYSHMTHFERSKYVSNSAKSRIRYIKTRSTSEEYHWKQSGTANSGTKTSLVDP